MSSVFQRIEIQADDEARIEGFAKGEVIGLRLFTGDVSFETEIRLSQCQAQRMVDTLLAAITQSEIVHYVRTP